MNLTKKHNFGAGPSVMPISVLEHVSKSILDWNGTGQSVLEIRTSSPAFKNIFNKAEVLIRELLNVPDDYSIFFFQGAKDSGFPSLPLNFLSKNKRGAYLDTGQDSKKAILAARSNREVEIVASSRDMGYTYIPEVYGIPDSATYFHCTSSNPAEGTQMFRFPKFDLPMVCDMSSDIFSRGITIGDFGMVYAHSIGNFMPAGTTLVIAKSSCLKSVTEPQVFDGRDSFDYGELQDKTSTITFFPMYVFMLNMLFLKESGGVRKIEEDNLLKSTLLYEEIDRNPLFYGTVNLAHRSLINVAFAMHDKNGEAAFLQFLLELGIVGIKIHTAYGGFAACISNALPLDSIEYLVFCMQAYEREVNVFKGEILLQEQWQ